MINQERLAEVLSRPLLGGCHTEPGEHCAMEAVAYVAGEPHSDGPVCACPTLAIFIRKWNDSMQQHDRDRLLKPLIEKLVGSWVSEEVADKRVILTVDWAFRVHTPALLDLLGAPEAAAQFRKLLPITKLERLEQVVPYLVPPPVERIGRDDDMLALRVFWGSGSEAISGILFQSTYIKGWYHDPSGIRMQLRDFLLNHVRKALSDSDLDTANVTAQMQDLVLKHIHALLEVKS